MLSVYRLVHICYEEMFPSLVRDVYFAVCVTECIFLYLGKEED